MTLDALVLAFLIAAPPGSQAPKGSPGQATAAPAQAAPAAATARRDPFASLRFLQGTWKAESGGGKPGEATGGGFSFAVELDGNVAVRRGRAEYSARPGQSGPVVHEDLMVVYPKGHALQAVYWDNEGHVIRYGVRSEAGTVTFESEAGAPGPRFRLVYARRGSDLVEVSFSMAPPGKPFQPYVTGLARRVRDAG